MHANLNKEETVNSPFQNPKKKILSLEFFPPKKEENLKDTKDLMTRLAALDPSFMTVTYGAGGGTRSFTKNLVDFIANNLMLPSVQHLTCVGHSQDEIREILEDLKNHGITNILALRGDPPKGAENFIPQENGFKSSRDLTKFIKDLNGFNIAVAGYPEGHPDRFSDEAELLYLKSKVDAGAEIIITQLFFDNSHYFSYVEKCRSIGIKVPILPGVMPISNVAQLERFTSMCGAIIPDSLRSSLSEIKDSAEDVLNFGIDFAVKQANELIEGGAPGLHLYTLNKSNQVEAIIKNLNNWR